MTHGKFFAAMLTLILASSLPSFSDPLSFWADRSRVSPAKLLVDTALSYTFVRETPGRANHSPVIDPWQKKVTGTTGIYWCMVYVWKMTSLVARSVHLPNPLLRTASCYKQLAWANSLGSGLQVIAQSAEFRGDLLRPGDIFIMCAGGRTDPALIGRGFNGHTGIVVNSSSTTTQTVEGNTSVGGSRNGDRVAARARSPSSFLAVIRIPSWQ